jgi:hypothetical protein
MAVQEPPKISGAAPKLAKIDITEWKAGYNSFLDEGRLPINALRTAENMMLTQDSIPTLRWGTAGYGEPLAGVIDGDGKFSKFNAATLSLDEYNVAIADGQVYTGRDGKGWRVATGDNLTPGHAATMLQLDDKVFIGNGFDPFAYYDITDNELRSFDKIDAPGAPTLTRSSDLSDGNYNCYYRVSAVNDVGETAAGTAANVTVNVMRESWQNTTGAAAKSQNITLTWTAVDGAERYNIYYGDQAGQECYIDSTASTSYNDDARTQPNVAMAAPEDDTTSGPKIAQISYSDNRIWGTGDPEHPYRVYWGGVGNNITAFSPFFGGGWVDIGLGGTEIPVVVKSYRDGKGDSINTVMMTDASGKGSQQQIALNTMTVGTTTFIVPMIARVVGSVGTMAPRGVVEAKNNLFFISAQGFNTTGAKPEMMNVLTTDEVSLALRPDIRNLINKNLRQVAAIYFEGKIFWAIASADQNNEIWVLDLELNNWCRPWRLPARWFIDYTDSRGVERLLYRPSSGDQSRLVELNDNFVDDSGTPFQWKLSTGLLNFDKTHMGFERVKKVYFEFLRAAGRLDIKLFGTKKNKAFGLIKNWVFDDTSVSRDVVGFSDEIFSEFQFSDGRVVVTGEYQNSIKKVVNVRKLVNNLRLEISGDSRTRFALSTISVQGTPKRTSDPGKWKR